MEGGCISGESDIDKATLKTAEDLLKTIKNDWFLANQSNAKYYVDYFNPV